MSWWVSLVDDKGIPVQVENFTDGGTYVVGGSVQAELNVTYNYGGILRSVGIDLHEGAGNIHWRKASECIPMLEAGLAGLPDKQPASDYWLPTPGNVRVVIQRLLAWAKANPDATFKVS